MDSENVPLRPGTENQCEPRGAQDGRSTDPDTVVRTPLRGRRRV
jgi:hypothetical protein